MEYLAPGRRPFQERAERSLITLRAQVRRWLCNYQELKEAA
jgi:hypothetical protein